MNTAQALVELFADSDSGDSDLDGSSSEEDSSDSVQESGNAENSDVDEMLKWQKSSKIKCFSRFLAIFHQKINNFSSTSIYQNKPQEVFYKLFLLQ